MEIERICTLEGLAGVRSDWNALVESSGQKCVFLTNEWFCTWFESFGESYELSVVLFRDSDGHLYGAAPLMQTPKGLEFIANHQVTDYCDFIVEGGQEELFFRNFFKFWQKEYSQNSDLHLINIREGSPVLTLLPQLANKSHVKHFVRETEVAPSLGLPPTYEEYLKTLKRKNRHEILRKKRKIESQGGLLYKRVNTAEGVHDHMDLFIELHRKSSLSKREFWKEPGVESFFRAIAPLFSSRGWIEFMVLHLQDELAAMLLNFDYADEIHFYNIAFDPKYAPFSPGIFLFNQSIHQAIQNKKKRADFLRGKEKYKYYFGAKECKLMDFTLAKKEMNS